MPKISCDFKDRLGFHPGDKYFPTNRFYMQNDGKLWAICSYCDKHNFVPLACEEISEEEYLKRLKLQAFK